MSEIQKIYYLHIPKTAGTALNRFLRSGIPAERAIEHIESHREVLTEQLSERFDFVSGHIAYEVVKPQLKAFKTVATFRKPLEHVCSHLTYVKEIGFDSKKYSNHSPQIQAIIDKLHVVDFSDAGALRELVRWLEANGHFLFHNAQTVYMTKQPRKQGVGGDDLERALKHIEAIDYVGVQERLAEFMLMLSFELNIDLKAVSDRKLNVTTGRYGLNVQDPETADALEPLIQYDRFLFEKAESLFVDRLYGFLKAADMQNCPEYFERLCELRSISSKGTLEPRATSLFRRWWRR